MVKRITLFILAACISFLFLSIPSMGVDTSAKSAVLIEAVTGRVLYEKDSNTRRPEASTTKIMTALIAIENGNLDDTVVCSKAVAATGGTRIYLQEGEKIKLRTLLYGLLLESGNDAAEAIAEHVGHGRDNFIKMMNDRAKALKLKDTSFNNPSGLPDINHYTTAYELALIAREALKNPVFEEIVSTKSITIKKIDMDGSRVFKNHNSLLTSYDGSDGVKTGFTKEAGRCLVSSATRNGVRLIAVTLKDPNDWQDHRDMMDYGFTRVKLETLVKPNEIKYTLEIGNGKKSKLKITNPLEIKGVVIDDDKGFEVKYILPDYIFAPVKKGKVIGEARLYKNGELKGASPLCAEEEVLTGQGEKNFFMIFTERFRTMLFSVLP